VTHDLPGPASDPAAPAREAEPSTAAGRGRSRGRLAGIDLARALAIIGMFAVHVSPSGTGERLAYVLAVPRGRSALLFGLLAGVGVALLTSSRTRSVVEARFTLAWRVAVLLPLGLALQNLDHGVYVILADYALLYVLAILVLRWSDRWLLAVWWVSTVVGSVGYRYGQLHDPFGFRRIAASFGDQAGELLHRLVLSGPYPLITWAAPFCFGLWLGRRDLRDPAVRWRLVVVGGAVAVAVPVLSWGLTTLVASGVAGFGGVGMTGPAEVGGSPELAGWWALLDDAPHSQRPLWLVSATASAVAVLGVSLVVADRFGRVVAPLVAAGQLAFTWYVAHLLVLHFREGWLRTGSVVGTFGVVAVFTVVMGVGSMLWLRVAPRGPLEFLLRPPWRWRAGSMGPSDEARGRPGGTVLHRSR
jgi:hypothetical protein